jgi:hypothetical protein
VTAMTNKRSNIVLLSLIGVNCAVIVAAEAFPKTEMRRNLYSDQGSCERDYSPSQCEETGAHGGGGGYYWRGPAYAADRKSAFPGDPGSGRTGLPTPTETSIRGGFGEFGLAAHTGA